MSKRRTAKSHSTNPSGYEKGDNNNHTEKNTHSLQSETSVEPNRSPIDNRQQNSVKNPDSS